MSLMHAWGLLLKNLQGKIPVGAFEYLEKDQALRHLKDLTGQDFGYDVGKWEDWICKNKDPTPYKIN
jgi:hypothetical protein